MTDVGHRRRPESLWLQAALVTAFFSALMIRQSMQHGRLALPPTFDDVSYLNEGAKYLSLLDSQGFAEVLKAYRLAPPHAPISTGAALAGFALLGVHDWVGAVTDAVVLFLFSRLFLETARDLTVTQSTLLLAVLWTSPFIGITLIWFRPDMIASLLVAAGTIYIVTRADWVTDRRAHLIAGVICGSALWGKPTIFPLTLVLFGAAAALASVSAVVERRYLKIIYAATGMIFVGLLIAIPYYVFSLDTIVSYIRTVVFGSQADIWVHPLPLVESLKFYLTSYYGSISIGWWLYGGIVASLLAAILLFFNSNKADLLKLCRVVALAVLTYGAVTVVTFKGPHGFPFAAIIFVAISLALIVIAKNLPAAIATTFCGIALIVSLWQFEWPKSNDYVSSAFANRKRAVASVVMDTIGKDVKDKTILFSTSSTFANFATLDFEYKRDGLASPQWIVLHLDGNIENQQRQIPNADVVVAYTPDFIDVLNLPTSSPDFRRRFIDAVKRTELFSEPAAVHDLDAGGDILVFKKRGPP